MQVQQCSRQNHIAHVMAKSTVSKSSPAILPAKKLSAEKVELPLHGCVQHANPAAIPCVAETDESLFRNIKFRVQLASAQMQVVIKSVAKGLQLTATYGTCQLDIMNFYCF